MVTLLPVSLEISSAASFALCMSRQARTTSEPVYVCSVRLLDHFSKEFKGKKYCVTAFAEFASSLFADSSIRASYDNNLTFKANFVFATRALEKAWHFDALLLENDETVLATASNISRSRAASRFTMTLQFGLKWLQLSTNRWLG